MSRRTRLEIVGFSAFVFLWGLFTGCNKREPPGISTVYLDKAAFHKVLTLFFDGVPPLKEERAAEGVGEEDPNVPDRRLRPEATWYTHAPLKDCARCHGGRPQRSFSSEVQLVAGVPELCSACHAALAPAAWKGWVHGPVAVGDCLVCHEPHRTRNPHLLKEQLPGLCYRCHQEIAEGLTPDSGRQAHSECLRCHAAHVGATDHATDRVPALCYECHAALAPAALQGWVHGPVAVGQCLMCHTLHETGNPHLLRERIPRLCYACHGQAAVKSIHEHWDASYVECGNCHEGHASPVRSLLRQSRQPTLAEVELPGAAPGPSGL